MSVSILRSRIVRLRTGGAILALCLLATACVDSNNVVADAPEPSTSAPESSTETVTSMPVADAEAEPVIDTSEEADQAAADEPCPAHASDADEPPPGIVAEFDADSGELSEGVAVDDSGTVFVSLAPLGQLLRFPAGSNDYEVFGSIPGWTGEGAGFLGLAIDDDGNVYGGAQSEGSSGVWRFDCRTGEATRVAGTETMGFANSLTFDADGVLYVTDSFSGTDGPDPMGAIWRIDSDGTAEKWLENTTLGGNGVLGFDTPNGANGIAYGDGTIYVANTERSLILAIPVLDDGTAGEISTIAEGSDFFVPDGIALDNAGRIYVAVIAQSAVKRINQDGSIETIAQGPEAGLDTNSSLAFGPRELTLYSVNLALIPELGTGVGPALVAIPVD